MRYYQIVIILSVLAFISACTAHHYSSKPSAIPQEINHPKWWKWRSEMPVDSRPFAYKGIIFAYLEKGILYAMDGISGDELWSFDFERDIYCFDDPLFYEELVLIALSSGSCYALNIYNGSVVWKIEQKKTPVKDLLDQLKSEIEMGIKPKDLKEYTSLKMPAESIFMYSNIHDDILFFCYSAKIIDINSSNRPFISTREYIHAINPRDGSILWEFLLPDKIYYGHPIKGFSCKHRGTNAYKEWLLRGKPENTDMHLSGIYNSMAALVIEPLRYPWERYLYVIDKYTGKILWKTESYIIGINPHTDDKKLYTIIHNTDQPLFRALEPENGKLIWEYKLKKLVDLEPVFGGLIITQSGSRYHHYDILFSESDNMVFLICYIFNKSFDGLSDSTGHIYRNHNAYLAYITAINSDTGETLWKKGLTYTQILGISGQMLYYVLDRRYLYGIDTKTGKTIKNLDLNMKNEGLNHDFCQLHGNLLLSRSYQDKSHLSAIDITTGDTLWRINCFLSTIAVADNTIYGVYNGNIYAIDLRDDDGFQ